MGPRSLPAAPAGNTLSLIDELADRLLAVHVGIDLALTYDFTAIAVCQVRERPRPGAPMPQPGKPMPRESYYRILQVRRWPHDMSVPELCGALVGLLSGIQDELVAEAWRDRGQRTPAPHLMDLETPLPGLAPRAVFADATGLGKPITSMFATALRDCAATRDVWLHPLTFVAGERYERHRGILGKTHLVANCQALLAASRLELRRGDPELPTLLREIDAYRISIDRDGRETFGAMSTAHDDLVTALALAVVDDPLADRPRWGPRIW